MNRVIALAAMLTGCAAAPAIEPPAPEPVAAPTASPTPARSAATVPQTAEPRAQAPLDYDDFWSVLGLDIAVDEATVIAVLGEPEKRTTTGDGVTLKYPGLNIAFRSDGAIQLMLSSTSPALAAKFPDDPLVQLVGAPCEEAAGRLAFTDEITRYTTCKSYRREKFLDVTISCGLEKVSYVVVVWVEFPTPIKGDIPESHC